MRRDSEDKEYFIDNSRDLFEFLIEARQWTGFDINKLNRWIKNFEAIENGIYYACKILNRIIGYSESDITQMLIEGIDKIMHQEAVLPLLVKKEFSALESEIDFCVQDALDNTLFAPLLVYDAPGESADAMMRLLTQKVKPPLKNKMFISNVPEDYSCRTLILVDDCIGSGEQFIEFWESAQIRGGKLLRTWCKEKRIHPYYLCLVAYDETIKTLQKDYQDITIVSIEEITERHSIFSIGNGVWDNEEELGLAIQQIQGLLADKNINIYGYKNLGFGVILHNSIPDWSLPILHKEKNGWKLLVERKDSND